jgi:hypothetical protein
MIRTLEQIEKDMNENQPQLAMIRKPTELVDERDTKVITDVLNFSLLQDIRDLLLLQVKGDNAGVTDEAEADIQRIHLLKHGVYRIYWKDGLVSVGAIGSNSNGERWLICSNWIGESGVALLINHVKSIKMLELIAVAG